MAQKLMVNQTNYTINGTLTVRSGNNPGGQEWGQVPFILQPNSQEMVPYGDANDPYVDQLEISAMTDGAVLLTDQIVITRGSALDNQFNMNDTVYINISAQNVEITTANTWTV
jgi:hypothetical protein